MDRLAILASTLAQAIQLSQAQRDEETTRCAASVAGQALDFVPRVVAAEMQAELQAAGELGDGEYQFPAWPWVLWNNDRVFRLLKAADVGENQVLRDMPLDDFLRLSPAMLFAAFGAPHKAVRLPPWAQYALAGVALVGTAFGVAAVARRSQDLGSQ